MESLLIDRQDDIYSAIFYGSLLLFAAIEFLLPAIKHRFGIGARWLTNISLGVGNILLGGLIMPLGLVALALLVESRGWGLSNMVDAPAWLAVPIGVLLLDLAKYGEHVAFHRVPLLWRLHVIHHADLDVDFTTGFRHHPLEAIATALTLPLIVLFLGVPPLAVIVYLLLAAITTIFAHANIRYAPALDRVLRLVFMTRDAHVVHHSSLRRETDSNYGLIFLFWDRLFGTYTVEPAAGLDAVDYGVEYFREPWELRLHNVLTMPFRVPGPGVSASPPSDKTSLPPAP